MTGFHPVDEVSITSARSNMSYSSKEKQREYQRRWVAKRRAAFFEDKKCVLCGSTSKLELDHINPDEKVSHSIWNWSKPKRDQELIKCQVLCYSCHKAKSAEFVKQNFSGENSPNSLLTEELVLLFRQLFKDGKTFNFLSKEFGVPKTTVRDSVRGRTWSHLPGAINRK